MHMQSPHRPALGDVEQITRGAKALHGSLAGSLWMALK